MMATTRRRWLVRLTIAIVAGLALGVTGGVAGVHKLEPGRPGQPDSLQMMLDSLRQRAATDPRMLRRAADSTDAAQRARRVADSTALANDPEAPLVPNVVDLEEGAARDAIEEARLTVGAVLFQSSTSPAGVVVATTPVAGFKARVGSAVNLILSDGRRPPVDSTNSIDSLAASAPSRFP